MNRLIVSLLVLASIGAVHGGEASAQASGAACNLTESTAPTIRGVQLGMSLQQLLAVFPGSTRRPELKAAIERARTAPRTEVVYIVFEPADGSAENFSGVESISTGLVAGAVAEYTVQYIGLSWSSIEEWVNQLSQSLRLPGAAEWMVGPDESPNRILKCNRVEIEAAIQGGGSSLSLRSTAVQPAAAGREAANEAARRRAFKP